MKPVGGSSCLARKHLGAAGHVHKAGSSDDKSQQHVAAYKHCWGHSSPTWHYRVTQV
jgi:hypothetical protein